VVGPLSWLTLGLVAFLVRAAFFFLVGYVAHLKLPVDPRSSVAGGGASGASRLLKRLCFSAGYPRGVLRKAGYPIDRLPTLRVRGLPLFIVLAVMFKNRRLLGGWLVPSAAFSLVLCAGFVSWRFVA
jgi:hypothetical protein